MAAPRPNGNTRTGQSAEFSLVDCTKKTRHDFDTRQADAEQRERLAATPTDGGSDMTNLAERWGRAIQVSQFISLLRRLNPALLFEISTNYPDKYGIYTVTRLDSSIPGFTYPEKRFICGMISGSEFGGILSGYMPEFSIIVSDSIEVPDQTQTKTVKKFKREIRGWRTVLAVLIIQGLITETQVDSTFHVSAGKDSANWQRRIHNTGDYPATITSKV